MNMWSERVVDVFQAVNIPYKLPNALKVQVVKHAST